MRRTGPKTDHQRRRRGENHCFNEARVTENQGQPLMHGTRPVVYETIFHPVGPQNLKSFVYNLDLHNFILEQLSVKFGFPCGLDDSIKNSLLLLVTINYTLSCTNFSLLTTDS